MQIEAYRGCVPENVLNQIAEIYVECFTGPPRFEKWEIEEIKEHILKLLAGDADIYVVLEEQTKIVSFGIGLPMSGYHNWEELTAHGASLDSYYFAELATRVASRGKGYGKILQQRREQAAEQRGLSMLSVRVRADNDVTIRLLKTNGFTLVASYEGTIAGSVTERIVMEKAL